MHSFTIFPPWDNDDAILKVDKVMRYEVKLPIKQHNTLASTAGERPTVLLALIARPILIVNSGYPGGWAVPEWQASAKSSPASPPGTPGNIEERYTVNTRVGATRRFEWPMGS